MDISPALEKRLHELVQVFLAENVQINLSALRTEEAVWNGHILDTFAYLDCFTEVPTGPVIDIGTGGGFPLLPLALAFPSQQFTGLDATQKKIAAVGRIVKATNIPNVELIAGRAEEVGHDPKHREKYGVVLSRAVASLPTLLEYCSPFAKVGGVVVLWKSLGIEEEIIASASAQKECRLKMVRSFRYALPEPLGERQLLIFSKTAALERTYPRSIGVPGKHPL